MRSSQKLSMTRMGSSTAATGLCRGDAVVEHSPPPITTLLLGVGAVIGFMAPQTGQQLAVWRYQSRKKVEPNKTKILNAKGEIKRE